MSLRTLRLAGLLALCLTIAPPPLRAAGAPAAKPRNITEKDLFDYVCIVDPQISPDVAQAVYVRVVVNKKKEGYDTSLWIVPTARDEQPRQFTSGPHDSGPRWSPDGKFLAFMRATEEDGKPQPPQLAVLAMAGGDAFVFTALPNGAGGPACSPAGNSSLFPTRPNPEPRATAPPGTADEP